jgi:hypothetical protein
LHCLFWYTYYKTYSFFWLYFSFAVFLFHNFTLLNSTFLSLFFALYLYFSRLLLLFPGTFTRLIAYASKSMYIRTTYTGLRKLTLL